MHLGKYGIASYATEELKILAKKEGTNNRAQWVQGYLAMYIADMLNAEIFGISTPGD